MTASQVTIVETVPAMDRLPVEKMTPIRGVIRVVPQVGQPAPRAISPVMMPAFSRSAEFCSRFFFQSKVIRPMRMPWSRAMQKMGSQSRKGWLMPMMPRRLSPIILRPSGKPSSLINSNLLSPPESIFIKKPKKRKLGIKPYQKRFSLVASKIPLPAIANSSNHFLQFMFMIVS